MTTPPGDETHADIAFDALVRVLRLDGVAPLDPPPGFEGLDTDGRRVLALLAARRPVPQAEPVSEPAPPDAPAAAPTDDAPPQEDAMPIGPPKTGLAAETPDTGPARLSLPNGRTRKAYAARIEGWSDLILTGDGGAGLSVSPDGDVTGTDLTAGEFTLDLSGTQGGEARDLRVRVSVIPDPRDLWVAQPSDREAPHWKPDTASASARGDALILAASTRGRAHAQEGGFRDDDVAVAADGPGGWHVLAVADGAGSAEMSRAGSDLACRTARDALMAGLTDSPDFGALLTGAARAAAAAIASEAAAAARPATDYATTLVLAVARKAAEGWTVAGFSVGDGGLALYDANQGSVTILCRPDGGEFAGQTRFLDMDVLDAPDVAARVFTAHVPRFTLLAAMTDGITDPKFPTEADLADPAAWAAFWDDLAPALAPLTEGAEQRLLGWLDFWARGNHDDRTLALLLPEAP